MGVEGSNPEQKVFHGGQMFIQLQDNLVSYTAGQMIHGIVHVNLMQPVFDSHNITIGLYGQEKVYFKKAHR